MSPALQSRHPDTALWRRQDDAPSTSPPRFEDGLVTEAWSQGFMVGSLLIMSFITIANMRRRTLLHKLILIELVFGFWHGLFIFFQSPTYNWWLSVSAIFLNASWSLHNVVAWIKNKPFLSRRVSLFYIGTVIAVQPYWIVEIYANFAFFHGINTIFLTTRPLEAVFRDPWWIFTTISLFWNMKKRYELSFREIVRLSPRFAVMLCAMVASICFLVVDICSVTGAFSSSLPVGINPFWKLSFVFKCLTDSVILDDFKTALDRLHMYQMNRVTSATNENADQVLPRPVDVSKTPRAGSYHVNEGKGSKPFHDEDKSSSHRSWYAGTAESHHGRPSSSSDYNISPVTRTSSEAEMRRYMGRTPISQPQATWRDNSLDDGFGDAIQEMPQSSQHDPTSFEKRTESSRVV